MAELDTINVFNPTNEDFSVRFNGEMYSIGKQSEKAFPQFLGFHVAKHLSDAVMKPDIIKLKAKKSDNPYMPQVGQLVIHDNVVRRKALYDILRDKQLVQTCIESFPFKGFIGEMSEYDEYVAKKEKVIEPEVKESSTPKTSGSSKTKE